MAQRTEDWASSMREIYCFGFAAKECDDMKPVSFKYQNNLVVPSGKQYPDYVTKVSSVPVYTDGVQCVTRWKLSILERIQVLFFGHLWLSLLSGETQPPACITSEREYLKESK
jgi:hypothetical protein